ncbi:ROK family protein [Paracoccus sp. S-4012]|uniref:ROK family protein n=1 Tax=Paracoccus sp. S-4012 TaxID=2665648 RepID=UPI0012AFF099|nr:ROK family protein [Paracoccus sp. S-4012]MRX50737.1 ROK family protein [Paracoccus sp. S-4012]
MNHAGLRLGIDLGGTKVEAAVVAADGSVVARSRGPNPGHYDGLLGTVAGLVHAVEAEVGQRLERIGAGVPGSVSPVDGAMRNANSVWLNGRHLREDLERTLGRPVRLANDANCMALSEAIDGAGADARVVFAVILGTGCGGGLVVDRRLWEGRNGVAGEWGHTALPWMREDELPGTRCWCGRANCIETYLSGSGLERDFREATGEAVKAAEIIGRAREGDPDAAAALSRHRDRLARALSGVVNLLDPDVFVIAGGLSNVPEILDGMQDAMRPYVFSDRLTTPVRRAVHGDSSGVRGAAWLWPLD